MNEKEFSVTLIPHRSLGPQGFFILMALICTISFATGMFFFIIGAWPVVGFLGLDVALIYGAFKWNYHTGKQREHIKIVDGELVITQISPRGGSTKLVFQSLLGAH